MEDEIKTRINLATESLKGYMDKLDRLLNKASKEKLVSLIIKFDGLADNYYHLWQKAEESKAYLEVQIFQISKLYEESEKAFDQKLSSVEKEVECLKEIIKKAGEMEVMVKKGKK